MKMRKTLDAKGKLYAKNQNDPMIMGNFLNTERYTVSCVSSSVNNTKLTLLIS